MAMAYFLTWTTYGTWLRGDKRGSTSDDPRFGVPMAPPNPSRVTANNASLSGPTIKLEPGDREIVGRTIKEVCEHRGWSLLALNVRSNHVHVVVTSSETPEKVLGDLKSWSTRRLRESDSDRFNGRVWTHHGSTRHLFNANAAEQAVEYVLRHQYGPIRKGRFGE